MTTAGCAETGGTFPQRCDALCLDALYEAVNRGGVQHASPCCIYGLVHHAALHKQALETQHTRALVPVR